MPVKIYHIFPDVPAQIFPIQSRQMLFTYNLKGLNPPRPFVHGQKPDEPPPPTPTPAPTPTPTPTPPPPTPTPAPTPTPTPTPPPAGVIGTLTIYPTQTAVLPYWVAIYPLKGQVPSGSSVFSNDDTSLRASIISTWGDGSARNVVLSGDISVTSGSNRQINLQAGAPGSGTNLTPANINTIMAGGGVQVNIPGIGSTSVTDFSSPTRTWWSNPRVICCHYLRDLGTTGMAAFIVVHAFSGGRAFIEVKIENCKIDAAQSPDAVGQTQKDYTGATITVNGVQIILNKSNSATTVSSSQAFVGGGTVATHWPWAIWYAAAWTGGNNPGNFGDGEMEVTHDINSMQAQPYNHKMVVNQGTINFSSYLPPTGSPFVGNMGFNGSLQPYGSDLYVPWSYGRFRSNNPADGGEHPSIGAYSKWGGHYVQSGDRFMRRCVIANALSYLSFRIHFRSTSAGNVGGVPTFTEVGNKNFQNQGHPGNGIWPSEVMPRTDTRPYGWEGAHDPDTSHFLAFSLRPSPVFIEIAQNKCLQVYTFNNFPNNGGFISYYLQVRGAAWAIREVMHCLVLLPDGDPWKPILSARMQNLVDRYNGTFPGQPQMVGFVNGVGNSLKLVYDYYPTFADDQNSPNNNGNIPAYQWNMWQPQWLMMEMHKMSRSQVLTGSLGTAFDTLTDWACQFPIDMVNQSIGGEWRYAGNHKTVGRADWDTSNQYVTNPVLGINSAPTWSEQLAFQYSADVPPPLSGFWNDHNPGDTLYSQAVPITDAFDPSQSYYHRVQYASICTAKERGLPGADEAYTTMVNNISNFNTWVAKFFDDPRWAVAPRPPFTATYALPTPGQAIQMPNITGATADSLSSIPGFYAPDSINFYMVGCFGSGQYVRSYSAAGAYVSCNNGGHHGPPHFGSTIFDFTTGTWSELPNANAVPDVAHASLNFAAGDVNANGEIAFVTPNPTPYGAPGHQYRYTLKLESNEGGGTKGSMFFPTYMYTTIDLVTMKTTQKCDLSTGQFTRVGTNRFWDVYTPGHMGPDCSATWDPITRRVHLWAIYMETGTEPSGISYFDFNTNAWANQAYGGSFVSAGSEAQFTWEMDVARRTLISFGCQSKTMYAIAVNDWTGAPPHGLRVLTTSGGANLPPDNHQRWYKYPKDGCWYTKDSTASNILYKMQPPIRNPGDTSGTWTVSQVSVVPVGAATLPAKYTGGDGSQTSSHYNQFFYIPTLECFGWIAGAQTITWLIKPP